MKKKLQSQSGETLIETLFSMLVIVLAVMMIAGSVVSAARVNKSAEDMDTALQYKEVQEVSGVTVKILRSSGSEPKEVPVKAYQTKDKNQYCYYELSD